LECCLFITKERENWHYTKEGQWFLIYGKQYFEKNPHIEKKETTQSFGATTVVATPNTKALRRMTLCAM
jgi:hypothetical protein